MGLRVRIPAGARLSVSCEGYVLSGRGLCVGLITCPEESYRVWCVCDREASIMRRPWPTRGRSVTNKIIISKSTDILKKRLIIQAVKTASLSCKCIIGNISESDNRWEKLWMKLEYENLERPDRDLLTRMTEQR